MKLSKHELPWLISYNYLLLIAKGNLKIQRSRAVIIIFLFFFF